jgi:hypothetical protein
MRIRRKFGLRLRHAPIYSTNIVQADTTNGSVSKAFLGLSGFHGCGYAAPKYKKTKGMVLFLRFTYAPIPKLFNDLQSERYFENRYNYSESFVLHIIKGLSRCNGFGVPVLPHL